ncbi:hypothetical protein Entas_2655 [Enterobacter soli]|uniref:glucosyltransferase domain-containing protein n=1 Tax=Enterobacter soli TaxID=885040 RepID=UPI000223C7F0|nr:glucosyltransferase domain-containing protein [Enterobacter soli]AEN65383.1 hypothetical protein Entas_2655 [Enterobacter soli]OAT36196.1 hypothetical protein M987_03852 [Enterobacter soli ATCC BAA-2102]
MFKSINKEISLRNAGLLSFALILFAYFPLLNDRIYFVDDITRSIKGYFGWTELGRPLTEWLAMLMTINSGILADITPLPQLLSIFVLSCTVLILIRNAFSRVSIATVLISTTAVINPLVLGNMLYRFDSLSMVFSIMFSVLAWEKFNNGKIALTLTLLVGCLCFYQPAIAIFPLLVVYTYLKKITHKEGMSGYILKSLFVAIISCLVYFICVVKLTIKSTESRGAINSLGNSLIQHTLTGIKNSTEIAFNSYGKIGSIILLCVSFIFIFCYLKTLTTSVWNKHIPQKNLRILLLLLSPLAILICTIGVNLVLSNGYYPLRVLFPIAFIIFLMLSLPSDENIILHNIASALAACLLFVAISTSYATASSLYQQQRYDSYILFSLSQYLVSSSENKNVYIFGATEHSLSSKTAMKAFPVINYVKNNYYDMTLSQALTNNGVKNVQFSSKARSTSTDLAKKACSGEANKVYSTPQYSIYSVGDDLLIYLGNSNCK